MAMMLPFGDRMINMENLCEIQYLKRTAEEVEVADSLGKPIYPEALRLVFSGNTIIEMDWKKEGAAFWEFLQEHSGNYNGYVPGQRLYVLRRQDGTYEINRFR